MQTAYLKIDEIRIDNTGQQTLLHPLFPVGFRDVSPFLYPLNVCGSRVKSSPRLVAGRHDMAKAC